MPEPANPPSPLREDTVSTELLDHLQLLGEPTRARMVRLLCREELAVGELARILQVSQPTVSRHLKHLMRGEFVASRKVGTATWVHAPADTFSPSRAALWSLVRAELDAAASDPASVFAADLQRLDTVLSQRSADSEALFARLGGRWDAMRIEHFGERWLAPLAFAALDGHGLHIADLGCGTGHLLPGLAATGARVTGVDREAAMLEVARSRTDHLSNVRLERGLLGDLPLADQTVDLATIVFVLHHIRALEPVFDQVHRVLRPGGRAVVLDMVAHDRTDFQRTMGHAHRGFSREALGTLAAHAGLQLQSHVPLPPEPEARGPALFVATLVRPLA